MDFYAETRTHFRKTAAGLFEITSPHVLYLSQEQAVAYSGNKQDDDYRSFHDETVLLARRHAVDITATMPNDFALIDLGPEYPDKTIPVLEQAALSAKSCHYLPVDINPDYVQIAADAALPFTHRVSGITSLFEDCACVLPKDSPNYRLVFIGLTFMNFVPKDILSTMTEISGGGSICVASELLSPENPETKIVKNYCNPHVKEFAFQPLKNLGFDKCDVNYSVRFNEDRVEIGFVSRTSKPELDVAINDFLLIGKSYRYTEETLRETLQENTGKEPKIWVSPNKNAALALVM